MPRCVVLSKNDKNDLMNFELSINQDLTNAARGEQSAALIEKSVESFSDNHLVAAVLAGDETAFDQLFARHNRRVAGFAAKFSNRPETVEDAIQITFTNAYFALKTFHGAHEKSFAAWILQIANRVCLDQLRGKTRRREDLLSDLTTEENEFLLEAICDSRVPNQENAHIFKDLADKLLARLEPEDRMLLRLLDADEMTARDVSEITGWTVSNVKVRAHRARLSLRKILWKFL